MSRSVGVAPSIRIRSTTISPVLVRAIEIALFGVLPALVVGILFVGVIQDNAVAEDFHQFYRAANAILKGDSPYPPTAEMLTPWGGPYPYPPLPALLAVPLTVLSIQSAGLLIMAALVLAALAVLFVLDVRDWRCYGLALLWPPVISAIQTGNVTLWLALAAALVWRYRELAFPAAAAIGVTLAAKFFLWPLSLWLAATRRFLAAALSLLIGAALLVSSWAVIGFDGFGEYPSILRQLDRIVGHDSYTTYILGTELGLPSTLSRAIWLLCGLAVLAAVVVVARRGDERSAFVLAIAAALALTPIVWLHYFALLLVVVALAQPSLGVVWFLPFAFIATPGSGHHTVFQLAITLIAAVATVGLALRALRQPGSPTLDAAVVEGTT